MDMSCSCFSAFTKNRKKGDSPYPDIRADEGECFLLLMPEKWVNHELKYFHVFDFLLCFGWSRL